MQESFAVSKIRPIRKVFIINEADLEKFKLIAEHLMSEIDGIHNLIFQACDTIFESNIKEFVRRFDPDVILNYSNFDNKTIAINFKTIVYDAKDEHFNLHRFGSPLYTFTGMPYLLSKSPDLLPSKVYSNSNLNLTPHDLFFGLNYGVISKKNYVNLKRSPSILRNVIIECVLDGMDIKDTIFDSQSKFCLITNQLGSGSSTSSSSYALNHNKPNHFEKDTYCFISNSNNLECILYFWNERVAFTHSKLAWLPIEFVENNKAVIKDNTTIICSNENNLKILQDIFPENKIILISEYYFNVESGRWNDFEHEQNLVIEANKILVRHPNEKTFSDIGFGGGYALEIYGISDLNYPKNYFFGELLCDKYIDTKIFPHYFTRYSNRGITRYSNRGITRYIQHFSPYDTSGITELFHIPTFSDALYFHFNKVGYTIKETPKTFILQQVINLLNGLENAELLCDEKIYNFIIKITPHNRTETLIKRHLPELLNSPNKDIIASYIGKLNDIGDVMIPSKILTLDNIIESISDSEIKNKAQQKEDALLKIQKLYNNKIILRGKHFTCEHCSASLWFALEDFSRINYCNECGNSINIPIISSNKNMGDHYKVNHLVSRAVDQGQLATLLLMRYLSNQKSRISYVSNHEIYQDNELVSDIDICVKIGNKLGLCECKSNISFTEKQMDELIFIADKIECDFILLSCLLSKYDDELKSTIDYLNQKKIQIPVFILTNEELFSSTTKRLYSYFEIDFQTNAFRCGPILI